VCSHAEQSSAAAAAAAAVSAAQLCCRSSVASKKEIPAHSFTIYAMPKKKIAAGDETDVRMPRMSAPERGFMIEWLGLERPGEGRRMLNFRWIYGGAAKGQNMNGEASDVHASSGYVALANYVNDKAKIKSDKVKAWTAESAEKRWTTMKAKYRQAIFLPMPEESGNNNFEEEMGILDANREKICGDFYKLYALLGEHPSTAPVHTADSMAAAQLTLDDDEDEEGGGNTGQEAEDAELEAEEDEGVASSKDAASIGSKRSGSNATVTKAPKEPKLSKQRLAEKKPFHLKKPTSEPSHKRTDIQTLFIKSQEDLAKQQHAQMRINAMLELIKAKIPQDQIPGMMRFMFGENNEFTPTTTTVYTSADDDINSKIVINHAAAAGAAPTI
jgi:hypothetical protein